MAEMSHFVNWEESESLDYITIAKAGGIKDLLSHHQVAMDDPPSTYRGGVDWFAHPTPPPLTSDPNYESALSKSWMQCGLPKLPEQPKPRAHARSRSEPVKLPHISDGHVDLSRLLSLDYQREWLEERESKQSELVRRAKLKKAVQKKKLREHTVKARKIAGVDKSVQEEERERFIMKRFAKVPAKIKLPPL